jgi:hypothetical protein
MQAQLSRPRMFKVLCPIPKKDGTTFWMRVGTGFPGKDPTTINLHLDALPINHKLHIREMDEEDLAPKEGRRDRRPVEASGHARTDTDDTPF